MYVHAWIRAKLQEEQEKKVTKIQVGTRKVVKSKGLFSTKEVEVEEPIYEEKVEWVGTGKYMSTRIDMADLANRITESCNEHHANGYDVVKIIDIIEGSFDYQYVANGTSMDNRCIGGGYAYSYGYSLTDGVIIIFKKRVG